MGLAEDCEMVLKGEKLFMELFEKRNATEGMDLIKEIDEKLKDIFCVDLYTPDVQLCVFNVVSDYFDEDTYGYTPRVLDDDKYEVQSCNAKSVFERKSITLKEPVIAIDEVKGILLIQFKDKTLTLFYNANLEITTSLKRIISSPIVFHAVTEFKGMCYMTFYCDKICKDSEGYECRDVLQLSFEYKG